MTLDQQIALWMNEHRASALDHITSVLMWLGSDLAGMALCGLAIAGLCLLLRRVDVLITSYAAIGTALLVNRLLKLLIDRPRPGPEFAHVPTQGSSMPSTAAAVTVAGLVVLVLLVAGTKRLRALAMVGATLLTAAIGYAVIYLGAHWFTDVIAGAALGGAIGATARVLHSRVLTRRSANP